MLFVTLSDSVKQTVDLTTSIQARYDILDRRLQQSHNIGDKFVLALDSYELVQLVSANKEALLCKGTFQCGNLLLLVLIVLQQLCGSISQTRMVLFTLPTGPTATARVSSNSIPRP